MNKIDYWLQVLINNRAGLVFGLSKSGGHHNLSLFDR